MDMLEVFHIFKAAIEDEKHAQRRYEEAMKLTEERPDLQGVFAEILLEEQRHEKILSHLYEKYRNEMDEKF